MHPNSYYEFLVIFGSELEPVGVGNSCTLLDGLGTGQVTSLSATGQNSRILSYRYHCRCAAGVILSAVVKRGSLRISVMTSALSLVYTTPGR